MSSDFDLDLSEDLCHAFGEIIPELSEFAFEKAFFLTFLLVASPQLSLLGVELGFQCFQLFCKDFLHLLLTLSKLLSN